MTYNTPPQAQPERPVLKWAARGAIASTLVLCLFATTKAYAQTQDAEAQILRTQFLEDVGAAERVNLSGKLRMLSQRIAAAACNAHYGIAPGISDDMLTASTAEFEQILTALEFGDESLGIIGEETDRRILANFVDIREHWDTMRQDIMNDAGTDEDLVTIANDSEIVLGDAQLLVSDISSEYSDPTALMQADAITIDIAGRQRMMAQRISKNTCLIAAGVNVEVATAELGTAMQMYEVAINALHDGLPEAGLEATDSPEILAGLEVILADWAVIKPLVETVQSGGTISDDERAQIFIQLNSLTAQMNALVTIYTEESSLNL